MNNVINAFPGYEFVYSNDDKEYHNMYRGIDLGKGGYIYFEPGIYYNVALLDIQSMHPNSAISLNAFGEYTANFKDILDARIAIKHGDYEKARNMLGGRLSPYLSDETQAGALAQALKIAINSVYGLTAANFSNPFRDPRNRNNIVALKGALFMKTLQDEVQKMGYTVCHIKTDSIKIPNATPEIIEFCMEFAKKYGYTFEHEATYERMCLINKSTYIAKYSKDTLNGKHAGQWTATADQFQVPYVFKTLFSREPIEFDDLCETKEVKTALYLDMNELLEQLTPAEEKELDIIDKAWHSENSEEMDKVIKKFNYDPEYVGVRYSQLCKKSDESHDYQFIGKVSNFCPIKPGCGGGELLREGKDKDGNVKYSSATGAKGYRWLESEVVKTLGKEADIDKSYYTKLVDDAIEAISQYGDFEQFVSDHILVNDIMPWALPCGDEDSNSCFACPHFVEDGHHMNCGKGFDISDTIAHQNKF